MISFNYICKGLWVIFFLGIDKKEMQSRIEINISNMKFGRFKTIGENIF